MGLDYSYQLYFHRDRLWPVLQSLAGFAHSSGSHDQIDIIFPDGHKLTLPFSSSYGMTNEHRDWANRALPIYFEDAAQSIQFNRFEFTAATTDMSLLFEKSSSIRRTFIRLLEEHEGVCGLFDDETLGGTGWLIWPGDYGQGHWAGLTKRDELIMAQSANQQLLNRPASITTRPYIRLATVRSFFSTLRKRLNSVVRQK